MSWIGLYDWQRDAVDRMHNGCILNGGVGSGKSITSLAYYYKLNGGDIDSERYSRMKDPPMNLFIITTAKKRDSDEWEEELLRFKLTSNRELNNYKNIIVIDSWNNIKKYKAERNAFFIFDEDKVTGDGVWADSFIKIARNNKWILLSATPGDAWTDFIAVFIANGFYRNKTEFKNRHIIYDPYVSQFPKIKGYLGESHLMRLRDSIEVDMDFLRPTERHDKRIEFPYDRIAYLDIFKRRWNQYKDKPIENAAEMCALLRRVSNNVECRAEAVRNYMDGRNMIIFYNFNYELEELRKLQGHNGYTVAEWNGHKHEPIPDTERWLYLVNYKSGAEGWNCIRTNYMIFFSQTYSYKELEQAKGRIDRANTPFRDLYYYHFTSKSPIDKAISLCLANKQLFNEKKYIKKLFKKKF